MNPAAIAAIVTLVELAIREEPAIATELKAIFAKQNPTPADWADLRAKIYGASFATLAPDVKLS